MVILDKALPYLMLQRTSLFPLSRFWAALERVIPICYQAAKAEGWLLGEPIKQKYIAQIEEDYREIAQYIPDPCRSILDIGCGMAGIDILLWLRNEVNELYLLDRSEVQRIRYGYCNLGAFYNSQEVMRSFAIANGVAELSIHPMVPTNGKIPMTQPVDVVISLLSWGFHYPIDTYLLDVLRLMAPNGTLILDIRVGTDWVDKLLAYFCSVCVVKTTKKYVRIAMRKR